MQSFKLALTSKVTLLLPLNGQTIAFGRTIQQGSEVAKNMGTQLVTTSVAVAPIAVPAATTITEQPQTTGGVASPFQASVSDLTNEMPVQPETPAIQPVAPAQSTTASAPANPSAELKIYDTSSQPLNQIPTQVQQDDVSIVVGPSLKNNAEELMKSDMPSNVLAPNQLGSVENLLNVCYFALSPGDKVCDTVHHTRDQGKQIPLLSILRGSLGGRVVNVSAQEWQKLDGGVVLQQKFGSTAEPKMSVNSGPGISLTGGPVVSSVPAQPGVTIGGLTIPAAPTDAQITGGSGRVDAVYILAMLEEITFIKPMIAMRDGSQSGATLYASSRNAQGIADLDFRLEMGGLRHSEIPMLAGANTSLMQRVLDMVHNDYSLARMYATGVDVQSLANHFS